MMKLMFECYKTNKFQLVFRISHGRAVSNKLFKRFLEAAANTVGQETKGILTIKKQVIFPYK